MAEELGLDLAAVAGTGAGGAVTKADVERAAAAAAAAAAATAAAAPRRRPPGGLRKALAAAMERANREIPHYYLTIDIELSRALAWLAAENARRPVTERLLPVALLLKAVALAARRVPEMNGFWIDGAFRPGGGVHLGVAIARRSGEVVVPAIHDADALGLDQLMVALKSLVERARSGSLRSSEITDATLTVTNLGDLGADTVLGIVYPPQVALVGFGRIRERAWVEAGQLGVRPQVTASLAADHRASDGYRGGRFLAAVAAWLQKPEEL
jgi:pyruvate dehydrogenase E2 component (dihydrolipoamide acetyltransferase)